MRAVGIDLCDSYASINFYKEDLVSRCQCVICKSKTEDIWHIGEKAYANALTGDGILVDKLVTLACKDGIATILGTKYTGRELLKKFIKMLIDTTVEQTSMTYPDEITVTIENIDKNNAAMIRDCITELGYSKKKIHVISHAESFIRFVMSQPRDIWNNQVGLFDLTDTGLTYYEMNVKKISTKLMAFADKESLDEGFKLEIISTSSGAKLADKIMTSCASRLLAQKAFSAVILTGRGFDTNDWNPEFMKYLCAKRKVYLEKELFAKGAASYAASRIDQDNEIDITCICDGRSDVSVYIEKGNSDHTEKVPIVEAGEKWYDFDLNMRFIPDNISDIDLQIVSANNKRNDIVRIPLSFLPKRSNKATHVDMNVRFLDEHTLSVELKDAGFGEIFPATSASEIKEINLWG